ncbi:MAG: hypothetical protein AAF430_21750 [Myxococcota bacterium]
MIEFQVLEEPPAFVVRAVGRLTDADLLGFVAQAQQDPNAAWKHALYDFSAVDEISGLSLQAVRQLGRMRSCDPEASRQQRVAIVVRGTGLYGMARILQTLMGGRLPHLRVFRDLSDAWAHLGIDERPAEA